MSATKKAAETVSPARAGAVACIAAVLRHRRAFDDAFDTEVWSGALAHAEPRDRAFARAIATTVLRRLGQIDAVLDRFLDSPLPPRAGPTIHILRCGLTEILFLDVAPHAAVDSAVALAAQDRRARHFKALVNAVLRRAAREGAERVGEQDAPRLNTPDWLWQSWTAAYGEASARAIADAHLREPPLDLSVKTDPDGWATRLDGSVVAGRTVRLAAHGRVETLDGFADGAWWVQDAAAALPARLLGDVAGREVLDLCAAPGGKTAQLAAAGATVTAVDRSAPRLRLLSENLRRLGLHATIVEADAAAWAPGRTWPLILLDAPCSATGTIRRHPDIPHLKRLQDRDKLAALQGRLLDAAAALLAPGGTLVYATCSLEPEEGPAQTARFLGNHPDFARRAVDLVDIGGLAHCIGEDGDLRTLPCHLTDAGGMDGFYAARLERTR